MVSSSNGICIVAIYCSLLLFSLRNQSLCSLEVGVCFRERALSGCYVCLLSSHSSLSIRHVLSCSSFRRLSITEVVLFGVHIVFRVSDCLCVTVSKRLTNSVERRIRSGLLFRGRIKCSLRGFSSSFSFSEGLIQWSRVRFVRRQLITFFDVCVSRVCTCSGCRIHGVLVSYLTVAVKVFPRR